MGVKISELPSVSTPLTGAEQLPIVQSGVTRKATAADLASSPAGGPIAWTAVLSVAIGAGATNDWTPPITAMSRIRVTAAGAAVITGLAGGTDGRIIIVTNIGANDVELRSQAAGSLAANRFASNGDTLLPSGCSAMFIYDGALSRWTRIGF